MKRSITRNQILILPVLTLMLVLLAACAPATPASVPASLDPQVVNTQVASQAPEVMATDNNVATTDLPAPIAVATSRGPDLEATDPATVNLASGQLQLVEFIRFS